LSFLKEKWGQSAVKMYVLSSFVLMKIPIIGISRLSANLPIISIGRLVCWYRPIVVYTVGKCKILFLLPKVNKHASGFRVR